MTDRSPYSRLFRERATGRVGAGFRVSEVAREFGVPHETLRRWCVAARVYRPAVYRQHTMPTRNRTVRRVQDGESMTAVARDEGLTLSVVQQWCKAAGVSSRHWSLTAHQRTRNRAALARRETAVKAVLEEGVSKAAAGRMVGVSATAVRNWLKAAA